MFQIIIASLGNCDVFLIKKTNTKNHPQAFPISSTFSSSSVKTYFIVV